MSQVWIRLTDTLELEGISMGRSYEPGDPITGTVRWEDEGEDHTLVVSLLWYTAGRGSEEIKIVQQVQVDASAASGEAPFELEGPRFPWSFSGKLVSLVWAVEASLEPRGAVDRVKITVAPDAEEILL